MEVTFHWKEGIFMTLEEMNLTEEQPVEAPVEEIPAEDSAIAVETLLEPAEELPVEAEEAVEEPVAEEVPEEPVAAPAEAEKPKKRKKKKPHIALRILLQLLSFVLSLVLFVTLIAGVLLADLRQLTSEGGIKKIINALLIPGASAPVEIHVAPIQADRMSVKWDETVPSLPDGVTLPPDATLPPDVTLPGDITVDENGNITVGGEQVTIPDIDISDIPVDILGGGSGEANVMDLVDWVYDTIEETGDVEMPCTKEEMRDFIQESTVADFVSEKLAGFTEDIINGTENTVITSDELVGLLKENEPLIKDKLKVEITEDQWFQIENAVVQVVEENKINETIRDTVYETVDSVLEENSAALGGLKREDIQAVLQTLTSDNLFYTFVGVTLGLLLLLCLLNFYNVPAGLTWASLPAIFAGLIMAAPILLLTNSADLVTGLVPDIGPVVGVLASFVGALKPIHYGLLGIGVGLLVLSIIWRIVRAIVRKNRA